VLNTEVVITTNENWGVLKINDEHEKKTEGLEMTIKLLGKYLIWKKTK